MNNTVFVLALDLPPKKVFIRYHFVMKDLLLVEKISQIMIQNQGLIIVFTSLSRVLVYKYFDN